MKKLLISILTIGSMTASYAGTLTSDLYRSGNASSPKMENVRAGKDVPVYKKNNVDWVQAKKGGISTNDTPPAVGQEKNVWKVPKGTNYPTDLYVVKDGKNHWSWEPAKDMPLSDYQKSLTTTNKLFTKLK